MDTSNIEYFNSNRFLTHFYLPFPELLPQISPVGDEFEYEVNTDEGFWGNLINSLRGNSYRPRRLSFPERIAGSLFLFTISTAVLNENQVRTIDWIAKNQLPLKQAVLSKIETSMIELPFTEEDRIRLVLDGVDAPVVALRELLGIPVQIVSFYLSIQHLSFGIEIASSDQQRSVGFHLLGERIVEIGGPDIAVVW